MCRGTDQDEGQPLVSTRPITPPSPARADSPRLRLAPGQRIGAYRVVRLVGCGGMGTVYEAVHEQIRRRVAMKVLRPRDPDRSGSGERFLTEARAANAVEHPCIIGVQEAGYLEGRYPYLIMDFLQGETLARRLEGPDQMALLPLFQQVAEGLAAAHEQRVIHRDLKPANVMIVPDRLVPGGERVKILDFGLAKLEAPAPDGRPPTETGVVLGTPRYMSPEQCRSAGRVDGKTDVYSLGVMLYEWRAGRPPFEAEGAVELMLMHAKQPPPPLQELAPEASPTLVALVHRMLAKSPAERPSMREVAEGLSRMDLAIPAVPTATPLRARAVRPLALLPALLLVALLLAGALLRLL